jgi:cytochrome c2
VHANGDVYDKAARNMANRAGILRGVAGPADRRRADAAARCPADRWCDAFKQQCATCHTTNPSEPVRQGPSLFKIVGRPAGKVDGFHYSAGFAMADFVWNDARLDAWLANPQAIIPGAIMAYRQPKAETRTAIIAYLKELN